MISLPTVQEYEREALVNNGKVKEMFASLFPDSPIRIEDIFQLHDLIDSTPYPIEFISRIVESVNEVTNSPLGGQIVVDIKTDSTALHLKKNIMNLETKKYEKVL